MNALHRRGVWHSGHQSTNLSHVLKISPWIFIISAIISITYLPQVSSYCDAFTEELYYINYYFKDILLVIISLTTICFTVWWFPNSFTIFAIIIIVFRWCFRNFVILLDSYKQFLFPISCMHLISQLKHITNHLLDSDFDHQKSKSSIVNNMALALASLILADKRDMTIILEILDFIITVVLISRIIAIKITLIIIYIITIRIDIH